MWCSNASRWTAASDIHVMCLSSMISPSRHTQSQISRLESSSNLQDSSFAVGQPFDWLLLSRLIEDKCSCSCEHTLLNRGSDVLTELLITVSRDKKSFSNSEIQWLGRATGGGESLIGPRDLSKAPVHAPMKCNTESVPGNGSILRQGPVERV